MKKLKKNQKIQMTARQIKKLKLNATVDAVKIVSLLPLMILRDKHGFGEKRLKNFVNDFNELFEAYSEGYLDLEDMAKVLHDETNLEINKEFKL